MKAVGENADPSTELMVRLLEEDVWCKNAAASATLATASAAEKEKLQYLRTTLFPTLVPALHELAKREQAMEEAAKAGQTRRSKYGATENTDPVAWLAHYLLRNNSACPSSKIRHHPFAVNNAVSLVRQTGEPANE